MITVVVLAHLPLLWCLAGRLWATEHYQFFPVILVGTIYLGYQRAKGLGQVGASRRWLRIVLAFGSFALLAMAVLLNSQWLAAVAAMLSIWMLLCSLSRRKLRGRVWPAWLLLWLAVPMPLGLDEQLNSVTAATRDKLGQRSSEPARLSSLGLRRCDRTAGTFIPSRRSPRQRPNAANREHDRRVGKPTPVGAVRSDRRSTTVSGIGCPPKQAVRLGVTFLEPTLDDMPSEFNQWRRDGFGAVTRDPDDPNGQFPHI